MTKKIVIIVGAVAALLAGLFFFFLLVYKDHGEPAERINLAGTENFYRISKQLYRAGQPTAEGMRIYEDYGIKTIINLRSFNSDREEVRGTGLMVAMYRIVEQGWDKEEAIKEMTDGGFGFHGVWVHIPGFIRKADIEQIERQLR